MYVLFMYVYTSYVCMYVRMYLYVCVCMRMHVLCIYVL